MFVPLLVLFLEEGSLVGLCLLHLLASMLSLVPAFGEKRTGGVVRRGEEERTRNEGGKRGGEEERRKEKKREQST